MARKHKSPRTLRKVENRYDAAGSGRRMAGWNAPSTGPNKAVVGLQKIRDRVRDAVRNDWAGASSVRVWTTNIVGTGITPRLRTKEAKLKEKLNKLWNSWVPFADADGVLDFYGLQLLGARTWFSGGELFIRERPRRPSDGLPVPYQVQLLEGDMVPLLDTAIWPGLQAGNMIYQGIEVNPIGQRVAYWFYKQHPGDNPPAAMPQELTRVPAEFVQHLFDPQRPGQMRGVSDMASIAAKLRNVMDFDDAVLEKQKLSNLFTLFITRALPSGSEDSITGLPFSGDPNEPIAGLEPGISQELLPGEDVKFSTPPDAGANYTDFMRMQNLGVAAGMGTPYELLSGDVKDVSDRTLRVLINEFRRLCEQRQWLLFIPKMCQPVRASWAKYAELSGVLTPDEAVEARNVDWAPQGWAYIHPVQDVQAKQLEVEAGFRSRSSVISERGYDPDSVDQERADENKREDQLGLKPDPKTTPANKPA
jgi:lambda family phage portal protein